LRANAESHRARIGRACERVVALAERSERATRALLRHRAASLARCGELLNALSHRGVLARGFALVRDLEGRPLRQAAAIAPGMAMDLEFFDGHVRASAERSSGALAEKPQGAPRSRGRRGGDSGQGSLFG
jgi:exodeoxyribonuclease VII large subunit